MTDFQSELKSFNKRLELLHNNLESMKQLGIDEDLLIAYLCHKLKLSEKKAKEMLHSIEEFYDKLVKGGVAKTIKHQSHERINN
jgi:ribosomal 50S subunit-associated protein YjgA (DUF615 family)